MNGTAAGSTSEVLRGHTVQKPAMCTAHLATSEKITRRSQSQGEIPQNAKENQQPKVSPD